MNHAHVMRCKLVLHEVVETKTQHQTEPNVKVRFGAVWEGSPEKQAVSENAIFGKMTPMAEFVAILKNPEVISGLVPGRQYYVDFISVPTDLESELDWKCP